MWKVVEYKHDGEDFIPTGEEWCFAGYTEAHNKWKELSFKNIDYYEIKFRIVEITGC